MVSHFSKEFLVNRHPGCQLFLAQSIQPEDHFKTEVMMW